MTRPRLIETFNTHRMTAAVILAVKTARDLELEEAMQAVRQAASQPRQTAQHLIVYGERGSGKSFLMRLIEIETEKLARQENLAIVAALLPEEQYNIRSAPQLLQAIAAKVRGAGWEAAAYALDFRPQAEAWNAAVADLNAALDQRFGQGLGLAVAMVENFDSLTRSLFGGGAAMQKKTASAKAIEQNAAEQLLRKLMNSQGSRLMLIASATGTVDQDYERPLFQVFKTLDLQTWTSDDCIAYFNRRRALENQPDLSPAETARARAIAEFIGGNPRLAQLLGEVLASPDARGVAATLDALSDHLADYYRHRLEDLPPQSAALLDALIRKGEPCTQTELAARVGASSQAQIADAFSYLLSGRLLAAGPDKVGAGRLYRVRDRLFVHFYRRRYGDPEQALGLAPIAELLESFFTQREREEHTRKHLEAGELADARLYALNSPFLTEPTDGFCGYRDSAVIGTPSELFGLAGLSAGEATAAQAELKDRPELAVKSWNDRAKHADSGLARTAACLLKAIALSRCQMDHETEDVLTEALQTAEVKGDQDAQILVLTEMAGFASNRQKDRARALEFAARVGELAEMAQNEYARALALWMKAWYLTISEVGQFLDAIAILDQVYTLAVAIGSQHLQARALRLKAYALNQLRCYEEAVAVAQQAAELAAAAGAVSSQSEALSFMSNALFEQGQHEAAAARYGEAAQLAGSIKDEREQSRLLNNQAISLRQLKRPEQALTIAREAAAIAEKIGDSGNQARALSIIGYALNDLRQFGQFAEAATALEQAAQLAASVGDTALQLDSLTQRVWSLGKMNQHKAAVELTQTVCELASKPEYAEEQSWGYSLQGWSLAKLHRTDEATAAFAAAFRVAESAGLKQRYIGILQDQSNSLGQQQPEQTLAFARTILAETLADWQSQPELQGRTGFATPSVTFENRADSQNVSDGVANPVTPPILVTPVDEAALAPAAAPAWTTEQLWTVRRIFFDAAARTLALDVVEVFGSGLAEATSEASAEPLAAMLDTALAAVAYNSLWDEFAACVSRQTNALAFLKSASAFDKVGKVWSEQVKAQGRVQTYAAIARQLPAIVRLVERLPCASMELDRLPESNTEVDEVSPSMALDSGIPSGMTAFSAKQRMTVETDGHLRNLINGLVNHCDDAGFLQDLADLLREGFGEKAEPEIQRLRAFAEVHAAPDKEKVLQRLDPDLALAIRRILGLPEPDDLLAQKGRRKGR